MNDLSFYKPSSGVVVMNSHARRYKLLHTGVAFTMSLAIAFASTAQADVSQSPLLLGGGSVPGNLALVPSVEWPTILSMANLGEYSVSNKYVGYFDSDKCYDYSHDADNSDRRNSHFFPKSKTSNRSCAGQLWSGNFLNWAATQTIDPFRSALTGGYRVRDTPTETWLEKARHTGQNASGTRAIWGGTAVSTATPANWYGFRTHLAGLGNRMRFTLDGDLNGAVSDYVSGVDLSNNGSTVYEVYMRVKVCDSEVGLETNCKRYAQGYKPEGLIQQYSSTIRYSIFSYLNDHSVWRDGGVLRARQKFVGQTVRVPGEAGNQVNMAREWDAIDGTFVRNPDAADATNTNAVILDSGVINYLNKFGQMTSKDHKHYDPVSELFYTALRYFKNQGNVPAYSDISGNEAARYELADGFPVITDWANADPIQYACQKNVILGIGDTNTHRDKNLPGNSVSSQEPTTPKEVSDDDTVDVVRATQKVADLEGITITTPFNNNRLSSAYIAGLAYDAHTTDLRKDWSGKQTVSTYWVDVREDEKLAGKASNPYWLAAKYGGFTVPKGFDTYTRSEKLPESWWHTSSEMLATGYPRPDNFYVASDAAKMIESLELAFANIAKGMESTTTSLAANSTRLDTDTAVFQSELNSKLWSGNLLARLIVDDQVGTEVSWKAASVLDALSDVNSRNIFTSVPPTADSTNGPLRSTKGIDFKWGDLQESQRAGFIKQGDADTSVAQQRVAFLRGDRSLEITDDHPERPFRQRASRLGDIVNSDPQFIHQQNFGYSALAWNDGAVGKAYAAFRAADTYKKRTPMIVVGANDGMLHGFDARVSKDSAKNGGRELFAYVPNNVLSSLIALTEPAYSHRYYVDATPRISDAWLGRGSGWRTVAVGATGAGGNSVFALDVTDPDKISSDSVLWEFTHPSMGYTMGQPALVALPNQKFGVIVSSGYHDSAPANGKVWILDVADGSVIKEFTLATTGGLGTPLVSDLNSDQVVDRVYVADTQGNLWRLDLSGSSAVSWGIPSTLNAKPLFIAKNDAGARQAITAPLTAAFNDKKQPMVFFGTGSFYRTGDNEVPVKPAVESFYGIIDNGLMIEGRGNLREQQIIKEARLSSGDKFRAITQNELEDGDQGWYLDLAWRTGEGATGAQGERVVAKASLRNDRVIFTTMTPSADPCDSGGSSWIMSVALGSGGRLSYVYFDTNGDGILDDKDLTMLTDDGAGIPWSGYSDEDAGVLKGTAQIEADGATLLCFAGSNGAMPRCIETPDTRRQGRQSWHEVRAN